MLIERDIIITTPLLDTCDVHPRGYGCPDIMEEHVFLLPNVQTAGFWYQICQRCASVRISEMVSQKECNHYFESWNDTCRYCGTIKPDVNYCLAVEVARLRAALERIANSCEGEDDYYRHRSIAEQALALAKYAKPLLGSRNDNPNTP